MFISDADIVLPMKGRPKKTCIHGITPTNKCKQCDTEKSRKWTLNHPEKSKESHKNWKKNNPEKVKESKRKYRKNNFEKFREYHKQWRKNNPEHFNKLMRKVIAKRKRSLGYIPINEYFEGSQGHHIDNECVIHIPKSLHRSIPHNIFINKNIVEINNLAFEFLECTNQVEWLTQISP